MVKLYRGQRIAPKIWNDPAKNQAQKIICTEDGACGQARPPPPPTTRRSDRRDIGNHKNRDDITRRPQPRRSRNADNDEDGWQTVRRQPPRHGPTSAAKAAMSRTTAVMGTHSSATPAVSLAIRRSFVPTIRGTAKKTMPPELQYSTLQMLAVITVLVFYMHMMMAIMIMIFLLLNCLIIMLLGILILVIMSMFAIILWYVRTRLLTSKVAIPSTDYLSQYDSKHLCDEVNKHLNCNTLWSNHKVVKSPGDGHCFIHAAANSLNVNSSMPTPFDDVSVILKQLSDETMHNSNRYVDFIDGNGRGSLLQGLHEYVNNRRYDTSFGDLVPIIIANALSVSLLIIENNGSQFEVQLFECQYSKTCFNVFKNGITL